MSSQESGGSCESVESVDSNGEVQMGFRRCGGSYKFKKRLEQFLKFKVLDLGVVLIYFDVKIHISYDSSSLLITFLKIFKEWTNFSGHFFGYLNIL